MKTIFYILSVLVIGAAGFFGYQNSEKIKEQISTFADTRTKKDNVIKTIEKTEETLGNTEKALDDSKNKNAELIQTNENEVSKETQMRRSIEKYAADIEDSDKKLEEFAKIKAEIQEKLQGEEIPWEQIKPEITKLKDERKRKGDDLDQLQKLVDKLDTELKKKKADLTEQSTRLAVMRKRVALNAKEGAITVVDTTWGFVVVNLGENNSNITPRSKLLVTRGGRLLARLTPNSVEAAQTICDLNAKDITPGVRIQPGDRVTLAESVGN